MTKRNFLQTSWRWIHKLALSEASASIHGASHQKLFVTIRKSPRVTNQSVCHQRSGNCPESQVPQHTCCWKWHSWQLGNLTKNCQALAHHILENHRTQPCAKSEDKSHQSSYQRPGNLQQWQGCYFAIRKSLDLKHRPSCFSAIRKLPSGG